MGFTLSSSNGESDEGRFVPKVAALVTPIHKLPRIHLNKNFALSKIGNGDNPPPSRHRKGSVTLIAPDKARCRPKRGTHGKIRLSADPVRLHQLTWVENKTLNLTI